MPNLPGFEFADHIIRTLNGVWMNQIKVYNDAWKNIEGGNYELKNLLADSAKLYRSQVEAYRGMATFGVKSVEWQQRSLRPGAKQTVSFELPSSVSREHVRVSRADRNGGFNPAHGLVTASEAPNQTEGVFTVEIEADGGVQDEDQWIAFVFDKLSGGSPLGAILILIENPPPRP